MSLSEVDILNIALSKIGDYYISSLTEGTKQQIFAVMHWENARDNLLMSFPWNFATSRVALARVTGTPIGYDYKYQLPTDCLRIIRMDTEGDFQNVDSSEYKIEGRLLLTDETTVYVKYIKQITDTSAFTPLFTRALAIQIAMLLAEPLGSAPTSDKQLLMAEYEAAINEARGIDFEEGQVKAEDYYSMTSCRDN